MIETLKRHRITVTVIPTKPGNCNVIFRKGEEYCRVTQLGNELSSVIVRATRAALGLEKFIRMVGEDCVKELNK